jgi:hypothetical protein
MSAMFLLGMTFVSLRHAQALTQDEQSVTATKSPKPRAKHAESWTQSTLRFAGGMAFSPGHANGFYGRVDYGSLGPLVGVNLIGLDGWKANDGWGLGIPSSLYVWYPFRLGHDEAPALVVMASGGFSWGTFDRFGDRNHFGIFTPQGSASFGLMMKRWHLLADGQAEYRWHFTGDNQAQFRVGLSFVAHFED